MGNGSSKELVDYLMNPEAAIPSETVIVTTEEPTVEVIPSVITPEDRLDVNMTMLMARLKEIGMNAKDVHYRAKGKAFFALHEMADLIWDMDKLTDNIAEIYFMGERLKEPPLLSVVYAQALTISTRDAGELTQFIERLRDSVGICIQEVEEIKKEFPDLTSGVVALLDEISQKSLIALGFLEQTLKK